MKRTALLLAAASLAFTWGGTAIAADHTMKIAHVVPQGDPRDLGARRVGELLKADDRCDIDVTVYPSGQLGGTADLIEGMQIGSIESVILPAAFMVGFEPKIGIFDFSFFWPTDEAKLLKIQQGPAMQKLLKTTEDQGVVSLAVWFNGYKVWIANRPMKTIDDFKGMKVRVMPSEILVAEKKLLGMTPTSMPFTETYSALQNGTIDGQDNPIVVNYVMKFQEVTKYMSVTNHGNLDQLVMFSKSWWDRLPDGCHAAITDAVHGATDLVVDKINEMTATGMEAFKKAGVEIYDMPEAELVKLRDASLPGVEKVYVEKNGEEGRAILEAFKKEIGIQ